MTGWTLFRAEGLSKAVYFLKAMAGSAQGDGIVVNAGLFLNREMMITMVVAVIGAMPIRKALTCYADNLGVTMVGSRLAALRMAMATSGVAWQMAVLFYSVVVMAAQTYNPFIYFRF